MLDCVPPPPKEGNVYAFIRLQPGRFYGLADEINVSDVVNKPGEYDLTVTYGRLARQLPSSSTFARYPSRGITGDCAVGRNFEVRAPVYSVILPQKGALYD